MSDQNKNVVRRLFDELWNKGTLQVADEIIAPTYQHHDASTPDLGKGPESEKKRVNLYRGAFHDFRLNIEGLYAEGETVVARWSCRGVHKGDLNGIAPTNMQFAITGMTIWQFNDIKGNDQSNQQCGPCKYFSHPANLTVPWDCEYIDVNCGRPGGENHKGSIDFWRRIKTAYGIVSKIYGS